MNSTGFAIVISNVSISQADLPFILEDRLKLVQAGEFEVQTFNDMLNEAGYFSNFMIPFGSIAIHTTDENGIRTEWMPPKEQTIYAVEFSGFNSHLQYLHLAGLLVFPKFRFGMEGLYADDVARDSRSLGGFFSYHQLELMKEGNRRSPGRYSKEVLNSLKYFYEKIIAEPEGGAVFRVLKMYSDTDSLPDYSSLLTLSYFSILEAIVTNGRQDGESITKQLLYKIRLLLNRSEDIEHETFFRGVTYDTLWKKLYSLRSCVAHGNSYAFDAGQFQPLVGFAVVNGYLDKVVASVIRTLIVEPSLVSDLRNC